MKSVSVFGATGSIGCTAAKILKHQSDKFNVEVITGGSNVLQLAKTAIERDAKHVVIADESLLNELQKHLENHKITISAGRNALLEAASRPVDISLQGIVGFAGVECSLIAARSTKTLALANKESLVCAGPLLRSICTEHKTTLVPVDSEHSAIFQCLQGEDLRTVERIILTASGGPFLNTPMHELSDVTAEQAAAHPRWKMGLRISIDSASMFNKAMELIETKELFDISSDKLEVIVQPQSIIHSMVGFNDGAIMAHMGPADMTGAIGYALNYPNRETLPLERLDFSKLGRLDFVSVDPNKFPAIQIAEHVIELSGLAGAVFNAAKEQALDLFLSGHLGFLEMSLVVERAINEYAKNSHNRTVTLDDLIDIDNSTRRFIQKNVKGNCHV